ncbi:MAG: hypothetical protein WB723_02035 [Candidatus Acidiferrales bacterium]
MKRSAIPGLLLALIGIVLFAHLGIARAMQKQTALHKATLRQMETAQKTEQAFPVASLLAGFFFMSGVGLVEVSAHPVATSQGGHSAGQGSDSV